MVRYTGLAVSYIDAFREECTEVAQTRQLIDTLKRALKAYRKTYADVALHLWLSEVSIKRLFS